MDELEGVEPPGGGLMATRWWLVWIGVAGCWSQPALIDDTFTEEEWAYLSTRFALPEPDLCPERLAPDCEAHAQLGRALFFDKRLSGPLRLSNPTLDTPGDPAEVGDIHRVACASCHSSQARGSTGRRFYYTDVRSTPNNVSSGAGLTKRNALSLVNIGLKYAVARENCAAPDADPRLCGRVFSWSGIYETAGDVLNLANGPAAMNTSAERIAAAICSEPAYVEAYRGLFGGVPDVPAEVRGSRGEHAALDPCRAATTDRLHGPAEVASNVTLAIDAYLRRLQSVDAPFDRYVAGDHAALTDAQRRGLAVFLRDGMCIECHDGPLLTDLEFHNTGVWQLGPNVPAVDLGLGDARFGDFEGRPEEAGRFLTPSLRNITETGPYMHAGQYNSLGQVIEFYRRGGDPDGTFAGVRDPRLQPLDITDDDARDLEAFLGALVGIPIGSDLADPPGAL